MDILNFDSEEFYIYKDECEKIIADFVNILKVYPQNQNEETIVKLMRDAHSIKGSSAIIGFESVSKLAHKIEDCLSLIKTNLNSDNSDLIAQVTDLIVEISDRIANFTNNEKTVESMLDEIIKKIPQMKNDTTAAEEFENIIQEIKVKNSNENIVDILNVCQNIFGKIKQCSAIKDTSILNSLSGTLKILRKKANDVININNDDFVFLKQKINVVEQMLDFSLVIDKKPQTEIAQNKNINIKSNPQIEAVLKTLGQNSIKTLRIETDKLDRLYSNIYELQKISVNSRKSFSNLVDIINKFAANIFEFEVILSNLKNHAANSEVYNNLNIEDAENNLKKLQSVMKDFETYCDNKNYYDTEFSNCWSKIQQSVQGIRTLPLGVILHIFPRMVRDIAETEDKKVIMKIKGAETNVDKKILEEIKAPLIHIIRNAIDHGIEKPDVRESFGKNRSGLINISGKNENGNLVINIKDDGCGINFDKIKEKALKEKILRQQEIEDITQEDYLKILFRPGFTTEDRVTAISGRGMGLDIVYSKISQLNGTVKINTTANEGTEVIIEIPSGLNIDDINYKEEIKIENAKKIAVIDDSKTTKMYLSNLLAKEGYQVDSYDGAKTAIDKIKNSSYDLIISDIEMPDMNGVEFISALRNELNINIPVVVVSMLEKEKINKMFENLEIQGSLNKAECKNGALLKMVNSILNN